MKIFTAVAYMSMVPYTVHEKVSCLFFHIARIKLHVEQRNSGNLLDDWRWGDTGHGKGDSRTN